MLLGLLSAAVPASESTPVRVVASFSIIGDFARQIGGERIKLRTLIGPDGDVHVYKPRPRDAQALGKAALVIVNGAGLEGWLRRLVEASGTRARVIEASAGIAWLAAFDRDTQGEPRTIHEDHAGHGHDRHEHEPHGWQTVPNARVYVRNIATALCQVDTAGCATYDTNLKAYLEALDELDRDIRKLVAQVPVERRVAVTTHAAFRYFGQAYGIRFIAAGGMSTSGQARPATLARLLRTMRAQNVTSVFPESVANSRMLAQLARDAGARIGGTLYADALTRAGGPAATYIDMMRHNATTLADALRPR